MKRICFLFNHDQTHQVAHSLPIALRLAETGEAEVTLAVTTDVIEARVRDMAGASLARCKLVRLGLKAHGSRFAAGLLEGLVPARKVLLYRDNLDFFRGFDALVVSEKTSLLLKSRYGLDGLKIIHTRHGAGDRAIGFGPESARFDLVLVAGPKIARRLTEEANVDPARIRLIGYAKFDQHPDDGTARARLPFADREKPTVLYNPHPSPKLSSWYGMGEPLLEAFRNQDRFNLIFAPHVMLFQRKWTVTISPPAIARVRVPGPRYAGSPHILIDPGSTASVDMTYTNAADLYVGDVSSQVYEFLRRPRPCLFLDAHATDWKGKADYMHWNAGPVIGPGGDLLAACADALDTHGAYLPAQRKLLADTFSVTARAASDRAAEAILDFLSGQSPTS